jgi:hypothetical protein
MVFLKVFGWQPNEFPVAIHGAALASIPYLNNEQPRTVWVDRIAQ